MSNSAELNDDLIQDSQRHTSVDCPHAHGPCDPAVIAACSVIAACLRSTVQHLATGTGLLSDELPSAPHIIIISYFLFTSDLP